MGEKVVNPIPTIGFNIETIKFKGLHFTSWDLGGREKIRSLHKECYAGSDAGIYVVDSSNTYEQEIELTYKSLHVMANDPNLKDAIFFIFANKQDINGAMSVGEVSQRLKLTELKQNCFIQGCSAVNSENIFEGFEWLANNTNKLNVEWFLHDYLVDPLPCTFKK